MNQDAAKAKSYARIKIRAKLFDLVITGLYLIAFQFFASQFFKNFSFNIAGNVYLAITIYLVFFSFFIYVITLPLNLYISFIVEHKFSLSNQSILDWSKDEFKKTAISFLIFLVVIQVLYIILRNFQFNWWVIASILWVLFTIILANIMPTLILPLFYKYSPLDNETLKQAIKSMARKSRIKLLDVYKIDFSKKTKKSNAAVIGLGNTRRVILADNLINEFPEDEVAVVVAHEFGHHKERHVLKLILFGALATLVSFYILYRLSNNIVSLFRAEAIHDIALFPAILFLFFIYGFTVLPLENWYSRVLERDADRFALKLTQNKTAFISLMDRLADKNLADKNPSKIVKFFFYDHPPINERIEFARKINF